MRNLWFECWCHRDKWHKLGGKPQSLWTFFFTCKIKVIISTWKWDDSRLRRRQGSWSAGQGSFKTWVQRPKVPKCLWCGSPPAIPEWGGWWWRDAGSELAGWTNQNFWVPFSDPMSVHKVERDRRRRLTATSGCSPTCAHTYTHTCANRYANMHIHQSIHHTSVHMRNRNQGGSGSSHMQIRGSL